MHQLTAKELTDSGICPTCYDRQHEYCLYGYHPERTIYENNDFECFLAGNPRSRGHIIISSIRHYKDMMEIPEKLCASVFMFARQLMRLMKELYGCESVYLCTMCDGPMNHFHIQLIPRYADEKRGSGNFVKPREAYVHEEETVRKLRSELAEAER